MITCLSLADLGEAQARARLCSFMMPRKKETGAFARELVPVRQEHQVVGAAAAVVAHNDNPVLLAEQARDGNERARYVGHPAKVRRHFGVFDAAEAEAGVVAFEGIGAHEEQRRLAFRLRQQVLDQRPTDSLALPVGRGGQRGKLSAAIAVDSDLRDAHNPSAFFSHAEAWPTCRLNLVTLEPAPSR